MKKEAICLKTGKPHRWRIDPGKKSMRYRVKNGCKITYPVYKCADCGIRIGKAHIEVI